MGVATSTQTKVAISMSAEDKTTWGEVCSNVGMSDNLYRTCRDKIGRDFKPANPLGLGLYDDGEEDDFDIDKALKKKALPVPKAPPKDWEPEPEGVLGFLQTASLASKVAIFGGLAVVGAVILKHVLSAKAEAPKAA